MLYKCLLLNSLLLGVFLFYTQGVIAEVLVTDSPLTISNDSNETSDIAPVKPRVKVRESQLCKTCTCNYDTYMIDCSKKQLKNWFSDDDWNTLQNGDILFETLKMDHNQLTKIPVLPKNPLKKLFLGFNQIAEIANGAFQNSLELSKLDLSHNNLTSKILKPDVFKGQYAPSDYQPLGNLKELDLGYNQLHNLDSDLFEHLPNLEVLILCKNEFLVLDHLAETAIAGLTSLKTLDMSYMELKELPDPFLHGPRQLEVLILTGNLFTELPDTLEFSINLKQLVLDENPIGDLVDEEVFPVIPSLEYLSISYMPELKKIGAGAFSNLQNLRTVIAAGNPKLSHIDVKAFAKNTSQPDIFDYPPLEKLYLNNNKLTMLDHDMLQRWDKVTNLDLRFNPWTCDCSTHWLIDILMTQIYKQTPLLTDNVLCSGPDNLEKLPLLDPIVKGALVDCVRQDAKEGAGGSAIWIGLLVGILVGIPVTIGGYMAYQRNCFGLLDRHRRNRGGSNSAVYNRPMFEEEF